LISENRIILDREVEKPRGEKGGKLGNLYHSKSLVNKLFLQKKLYNQRMRDGDSVTKHLNAFNTVVSQLLSVEIKILDEDKCISLL
jgi:hypothetical protein